MRGKTAKMIRKLVEKQTGGSLTIPYIKNLYRKAKKVAQKV